MKNTTEFSTSSFKKVLKSVGSQRVSEGSAVALAEEIESVAEKISSTALSYAQEDERMTVRKEDIRKAILDHSDRDVKRNSTIKVNA